jgi:hypothetical protein
MSNELVTYAMKQKGLSPAERLVYFALADWANHDGVTWPSNKYLSEKLELHPVTVRKCRSKLVRLGLITVIQRKRENGSSSSNIYQVVQGGEPEVAGEESVRHGGGEPEILGEESVRLPPTYNRNINRNKNHIDTAQDLINLFTPEEQAQWLVRFPNIDILYEAERCLMYYSEGKQVANPRPKHRFTNWLNNARPRTQVADSKPDKDPDRYLADYIRRRGALPGS